MVNAQDNTWPEADVEALKRYWDVDGLTASQIASKLGHTRNAVVGKARRLELTSRATGTKPKADPGKPPSLRYRPPTLPKVGSGHAAPLPRRVAPIAPLVEPTPTGKITLMQLSSQTCRWPIGDPGTEGFCFCGHTPRDGAPYCEYHARQAYVPARNPRMKEA